MVVVQPLRVELEKMLRNEILKLRGFHIQKENHNK